jgi:multidrug transporter EmrE-like cation transporter
MGTPTTALLPYLSLTAVILANVTGNILIKMGSSVSVRHTIFFGLFGWQTVVAITCFASGVLFYAFALRTIPLYAVQSIVILQFVGILLAATLFFKEGISASQWGSDFVALGLSLVIRQA